MHVKKIIGQLHLWLGLSSGLVVLFLGITGCLLAFQREIENSTQGYRYVAPQEKAVLPPSQLKAIASEQLPGREVHAVLYEGRGKAAQVIFYQFEPESYYFSVFLNPYDGTVLRVKNMDRDFFRVVVMGHYYLWLPPEIGQPIVASATLVFVVLLISGLVLWWPKNKAARRQRFFVKWNARWRRKNYDLHNVLGFYIFSVALVLAFTGLMWGFQWFQKSVYKTAGGEKSLVYEEPLSDTAQTASAGTQPALDAVWDKMRALYPTADVIEVHTAPTSASPIAANANPDGDTYWKMDYRYFDQYTLKELPVDHIYGRWKDAGTADKLVRMNYDLHTGAIMGLPGKILMFFASLIAASLPVTGFVIWWGRRKKKKNKPAAAQKSIRELAV